jgi:hypothetical protein
MRQPYRRREHVAERAYRNFGADMRAHAASDASGVKARSTVESVAIGKSKGWHSELRRAFHERVRLRAAFEKTECAGTMQLHVFAFMLNCR